MFADVPPSQGYCNMNNPNRWRLLDASTNTHGVTHFTLACQDEDVSNADGDYKELRHILISEFCAVEEGQLLSPYSVHKYLMVDGLQFGLILDEPDELILYARDKRDKLPMESFVTLLLNSLNRQDHATANQ